jgi:hypothetical protein
MPIEPTQTSSALAQAKDLSAIVQAVATTLAILIGGWWTYLKFGWQLERYAHVETAAEIDLIGRQGDSWIVELRAVLANKGKVEHRIANLAFDLGALRRGDVVATNPERFNGQVEFPYTVAQGSFLRSDLNFFSLGPGITAKYSYIAKVPSDAAFLVLHCWFDYIDGRGLHHSMEKTVMVPPASDDESGSATEAVAGRS